jgi:hypothetical protein
MAVFRGVQKMASRLEYFTMYPLNWLAYAAVGQVSVVDEYERELDEQAKKARRLLRSRREQERELPFDFWNDDDDDQDGPPTVLGRSCAQLHPVAPQWCNILGLCGKA